jgi:hypothetical protein
MLNVSKKVKMNHKENNQQSEQSVAYNPSMETTFWNVIKKEVAKYGDQAYRDMRDEDPRMEAAARADQEQRYV